MSEGRRMFLLVRRISAYTGPDVLLGAFATLPELEEAKVRYVAAYGADPDSDPWKDQAYRDPGLRAEDLTVVDLDGQFPTGDDVYVVADYSEGFGQIRRRFDSLHGTAESARRRVAELDAADLPSERFPFPHYALIDAIRSGVLHSDQPDEQPSLRPNFRPVVERELVCRGEFRGG